MSEPIDTSGGGDSVMEQLPSSTKLLRKTTTSSSTSTATSRRNSLGQLVRAASYRIMEANPPGGMWSATGQIASKAPSMSELRGSSYSSSTRRRRSSQPLQSPPILENDGDARSLSSTPFMTPLQTPMAIVNSGWLEEPEEMDTREQKDKKDGKNQKLEERSQNGTKSSGSTIHGDLRDDRELSPAIAMMARSEISDQSYDASKRNSAASKRLSTQSTEPTNRTSILGRLIKGKENEAPAPLDGELSPEPKRHSKNLDKFFGEDISRSRTASALDQHADLGDQPKRRSKNLDKMFGEDTSRVVQPTAPKEQRRTRDFADMMEGGDDDGDFPETLFDRDTMPTQSYDPVQRKVPGAKVTPAREAPATHSSAKEAFAKQRLSRDIAAEPPKLSVRAVESPGVEKPTMMEEIIGANPPLESASEEKPSASTSVPVEDDEEDEEEDVDWDEFMREFDERPPRQSKRLSKNLDKFFGEDPDRTGSAPPAPAAAAAAPKEDKRKRWSKLPDVADEPAAEKEDGASPTRRNQTNLRISTQPQSMPKSALATQQPATVLATAEQQVVKEAMGASPGEEGVFPTGYRFPPKKTAWQGFLAGCKAFWLFCITPLGFFVVLYGILVVAWGGMLFLLLCNASPVMCELGDGRSDCNDINSPRRIWVEYDSQILNALFCVTGFGLIPWRFRDFYYLLQFRLRHREAAFRRLAGFHNGWFRLPQSPDRPVPTPLPASRIDTAAEAAEGDAAYPLPASRAPLLPLTGRRAPATPVWKIDFVIWAFVINTGLQAVLSGFMWGYNRYARPSWSTGLFVALACIVAACGGIVQFVEGRKIKRIEGVPWDNDQDMDHEMGLDHAATMGDVNGTEKGKETPESNRGQGSATR